jgi:hypothetical protein
METTMSDIVEGKDKVQQFVKEYGEVDVVGVYDGEEPGQKKVVLRPTSLAYLKVEDQPSLYRNAPPELRYKMKMSAATIYRDTLMRSDLDLAQPDVVNEAPHKLYEKVRGYYRSKDVFGSFIDVMVDLAISGFENDCEDANIKEFYDNWCQDIDIEQILDWVYQEFFTSGLVRTYKVLGKYEPQVNRLKKVKNVPKPVAPKKMKGEAQQEFASLMKAWEEGSVLDQVETAEKKKRWSKGYVPIGYTVLNPVQFEIKGALVFNQTRVVMEPDEELVELIKKEDTTSPLTEGEKEILKNIPPDMKSAIRQNKAFEIDPMYIGEVDYRRMPYERYAIPKAARAVEVLEYKEALKEADYSTIDGITSEVLVITIGDKDNPVTDIEELRAVAQLFDTAQKAYQVVWNHTLKVERVEAKNIDQIFGAKKFEQAERDLTGSLGIPRAVIDGLMLGDSSKESLALASKALSAAISYARRQASRWIYKEYKQIAEAFGFEMYPSVRWNDMILKDELAIKTLIMSMVDHRIISYHTAINLLDHDPEFEKAMMAKELADINAGKYGILGSPFQQSGGSNVQETQRAPKGTPSQGRPKNQPSPKTPSPATPEGKTQQIIKKEIKEVKEERRVASLDEVASKLDLEEIAHMEAILKLVKQRKEQELVNLLQEEE